MILKDEPQPGLCVLEPKIHGDDRGYFFESFNVREAAQIGIRDTFVQDNESSSQKGVLRGLHYQIGKKAQSKLVRVVRGAIWDVAVDLRPNSPTFGDYFGIELNGQNKLQMYIPKGLAHGFLVLEDHTIVSYKCDNYYAPKYEAGIRYDDPQINIPWPELDVEIKLSRKDAKHPNWGDHKKCGIDLL